MSKFLDVPIVLHWDMRQRLASKQIIEKKISNLPFAKIRLLYPETDEDWEFVKHIIVSKNNVAKFQIEFTLSNFQYVQELFDRSMGKIELLPIYTQECSSISLCSVLDSLNKNYNVLHVGFYLNEDNADEYIETIEKIQRFKNLNFCVKLDKAKYNSLCKSNKLHTIIEKISELYIKYPGIKLSFYDDEKIIKDIFYLSYYYYGNLFIDQYNMVSLYDFLPSYDCGLNDANFSFEDTWNALINDHACDLEKILEHPRYWLKKRMELKNEGLFHRNI